MTTANPTPAPCKGERGDDGSAVDDPPAGSWKDARSSMTGAQPVIGILGAGRFGTVLARLFADAGYRILIAGSGDPSRIALPHGFPADRVTAVTSAEAAEAADIVILALPIGKHRTVPADLLADELVIDAMNYWWEADGMLAEFTDPLTSSSEVVQRHFAASRIVKAFNHMGYADLRDEPRPSGEAGRKAIGLAGDRPEDVERVARLIDDVGFDAVVVGPLAEGVRLEPGTEPFGADMDAAALRAMIDRFPTSQRGLRRAAAAAAMKPPHLL